MSRPRRSRSARPRARRARSAALVAALSAVLALLTPGAAFADDFGSGMPGSGSAAGGISDVGVASTTGGYGLVGPDSVSSLVDSGYGLSDLDPVTGAVTTGDITSTLTDGYAMTADLAASDMMALDAVELARQAQAQADARRKAMSGTGGLKAGSVPDPYGPMVTDAVARYCPRLSAATLAAQLQTESNWNPRARSPVGAMGIGQFMPGTWASAGIDGNGDGVRDVWNPQDAIPSAAAYDCTLMDEVAKVPGDPTANMLAAYNAGGGAVRRYNGVPPYAETQNYVRKITALAATMTDTSGGQGEVGADGCPTSAPGGTLRQGADSLGIAKLCADSVAQAPTPEAARAIKNALSMLGVPYSQPRRMTANAYDCSSFVTRAYKAGGLDIVGSWAPTTYSMLSARWAQRIPYSQAKPGDLVEPFAGHVVMQLADGYMVHTNRTGDVSHVKRTYSSAYATIRVVPSRV